MQVEDLSPVSDKAIIRITKRGRDEETTDSGIVVFHSESNHSYDPSLDWEQGRVLALGPGDWGPVRLGDLVIIQAPSGGVAGSDIGVKFGMPQGRLVVITMDEVVCKVEED